MSEISLEEIGFLKSESKIYLALLRIGQCSAGKIAKETGLNRVSVYKGLETLIKKGLVSYVIKANRKEYAASNPKEIKKLIDEKKQSLDEIKKQIPDLEDAFTNKKRKVEANIYEGIKGAKAIWEKLLGECKQNDEWLILGAPKSAEILGGYFKEFNTRRARKKVILKIIYNKNAKQLIAIRKKQPLTHVRTLYKEYITPASLEVVNTNALLVVYEPMIMIFHLKSEEVAKSFRSYFDLLWKIAQK